MTTLQIWERCKANQKKNDLRSMALQTIQIQAQFYNNWAAKSGQPRIEVPSVQITALLSEQQELSRNMSAVEKQQLAIRLSDENKADVDIVIPIKTGLGIPVIPIGIGVVVVAGLLWRWVTLEKRTADLSSELKKTVQAADDRICADPTSAACLSWRAERASGDWQKRESLIESLQAAARKIGAGIGAGLEFAIVGAVIAGLIWLFKE
jgi:hypothetical protein